MKVLKISNDRVKYVLRYISENKLIFIYGFVLCFGLFLGAFFSGKHTLNIFNLEQFFQNFLLSRRNSSFAILFKNTLLSGVIYLLLCYFSGMFVLGSVTNGVILLFNGSSIGLLMGFTYLLYGLKGVAFSIIIILPNAFISSLVYILSCKESYLFSLNFIGLFTSSPTLRSITPEFKRYCLKFVVFAVVIVFSSLLDAVLTSVFWNVFNL